MHTLQSITILRDLLWNIKTGYVKQINDFFESEHMHPSITVIDDGYIELKSHKDMDGLINKFKEQFQLEYIEFKLHTTLNVRDENPLPEMEYVYEFRRKDFKKTNSTTTWKNNSLDDLTLKFKQLTEQEIKQ